MSKAKFPNTTRRRLSSVVCRRLSSSGTLLTLTGARTWSEEHLVFVSEGGPSEDLPGMMYLSTPGCDWPKAWITYCPPGVVDREFYT